MIKSQRFVFAGIWDISCAKQITPNAQGNSIIDTMASRRKVFSVMTNMHDGIIEQILQRVIGDIDIRVVEVLKT